MASVNISGVARAGEALNLTCSVTRAENVTGDVRVQWIGPDGNQVVSSDSVLVGIPETSGAVTTLTLEFTTLSTSHGGEYRCQADLVSQEVMFTISALQDVTVRGIVTKYTSMAMHVCAQYLSHAAYSPCTNHHHHWSSILPSLLWDGDSADLCHCPARHGGHSSGAEQHLEEGRPDPQLQ